ncbi:MAG: hypothetical protein LGR52_06060, partial [Candidatus Thiosymbion ectosymbiont of Robbea hypermnestra]|nr:hypothetical protein [Candidatus Thiosymbion ectosymbiont of Robbea hypermnestra]
PSLCCLWVYALNPGNNKVRTPPMIRRMGSERGEYTNDRVNTKDVGSRIDDMVNIKNSANRINEGDAIADGHSPV